MPGECETVHCSRLRGFRKDNYPKNPVEDLDPEEREMRIKAHRRRIRKHAKD